MGSIRRITAALTVALATSAALAGTAVFGVASAVAATSPAESATADFMSGPFHVQFSAQRAANKPSDSATGSFIAHATIGSLNLVTLAGPVTCLDVRGTQMGLFYPVASSSPSIFGTLAKGVFIYADVTKAGKPLLVGFVPTPFASTKSCAPLPGFAPITAGSLSLMG